MLISEKSLIIKKVFILIINCTKTKKSSLFLLMYFQVEKQEEHGHPSSVQKEFTVLTNVLPSRKIQKAAALKNTVIINCIYIRITVLKKNTVILQELYAQQNCTESTKPQESLAQQNTSHHELVPKYPKL